MSSVDKILFLDVCDTLYLSNTTFDFLNWFLKKKKRVIYFKYLILTKKYSPLYWIYLLIGRLIKSDIIRNSAIGLLKGYTKSELDFEAKIFCDEFLSQRKNVKVWELLSQIRKDSKIIIVSASIDNIIREVSKRINADGFISSRLKFKHGICLGLLEEDLHGRKHLFTKKISSNFNECISITDNFSDLEMVLMSDRAYIVVYNEDYYTKWKEKAGEKISFVKMY